MLKAVVIDSREPAWAREMTFGPDVPVSVQEMPAGDAWLVTEDVTIAVERKTLSDLVASIADGRLFEQCASMAAATSWAYLVVTEMPQIAGGCLILGGQLTGWSWDSIQGALLTVQELGVGVRWAESDSEYRNVLKQLAGRNRGNITLKRKREATMRAPGEEVLCSLPQISDGRAEALIRHCGSAAWSLVYLAGDGGGEVPGIGPSTKASARFALGLGEQEELTIISKEETANE